MESKTNQPTLSLESNNKINIDSVVSQLLSLASNEEQKDFINRNKIFFEKEALKGEIDWIDFYSNYLEFDGVRERNPEVKIAKTKYVEFEIKPLQDYLTKLTTSGFTFVDVFIGKYRNLDVQPSGAPIPSSHKNKITVMFTGKDTAIIASNTPHPLNDPPPPYNVGDPHP